MTSVTIPASVTTIGDGAFYFCESLTSVTIPASVTFIGDGAFYGCESLTDITVDAENSAYASLDGVLFNKDQTELICCPVRKTGEYVIPASVTTIGEFAFDGCENLTSVVIGSGVTTITDSAFWYCTGLTSLVIGSGVTTIGDYAFEGCEGLTDVYYVGSEEDWAAIDIGSGNSYLTNAAIHFCTVTVTEPTCTDDGTITYICTVDGDSYTVIISAAGHQYENGVCTVCGAKEPGAGGAGWHSPDRLSHVLFHMMDRFLTMWSNLFSKVW
ncbi:MAG: leucine-rich repeat domain-containing protein [Clostridiales bacterium]|nr:leucine-rich repeat domain-containing protein [Clostridiales bacterium]